MGGYKKLINYKIPPVKDDDFYKHREEIYATLDSEVASSLFGTATLSGGSKTVSHPKCTASSNVLAMGQDDNVNGAIRVVCSSGSFILKSNNGADHGVVFWWLLP